MAYKTRVVVAATGVNEKTLHYWDKIGLVRPSVQRGSGRGSRKLYSFRDVVAVAAALRLKRAGLDGDGLRRLVGYVKRRAGIKDIRREWVAAAGGAAAAVTPADLPQLLGRDRRHVAFLLDLPRLVDEVAASIAKVSKEPA